MFEKKNSGSRRLRREVLFYVKLVDSPSGFASFGELLFVLEVFVLSAFQLKRVSPGLFPVEVRRIKAVSMEVKRKMYESIFIPREHYASEAWTWSVKVGKKLDILEL